MSYKIYREDTERIYPYRVKGCDVCRYFSTYVPSRGESTFMIVPGEKTYRKSGYWISLFFGDGKLKGGTVFRVINFLPIWAYEVSVEGGNEFERVENAWGQYKEVTKPGNEYMFEDIKKGELLDRAQTDWVDFINKKEAAVSALASISVDYWEDAYFSSEVGMCISKLQNACDRYEKSRWGKIEFEDPCPIGEYERFK